jgi:HlyD family secretion protein
MRRIVAALIVLALFAGVAAAGWWYLSTDASGRADVLTKLESAMTKLRLGRTQEPTTVVASGFIEADEVGVSSELGGRVVALGVGEGASVTEGQVLVQLDDGLLRAEMEAALADVALAKATLAQVKAGPRQEAVNYGQAVVEQARAAESAALIAWQDAQAMVEDPQDLKLALLVARGQLRVIAWQQRQAQALADSGQAARGLADQVVDLLDLPEPYTPIARLDAARDQQADATFQSWTAWTRLAQTVASREGMQDQVAQLERQVASPLELEAVADAAGGQYEMAGAAVGAAQAQLDGLRLGATPEQIAASEAQVEVARAALQTLQVQLDKLVLRAPITGTVLESAIHVGEVAIPGARLLTLADPGRLVLTMYVPEDWLSSVQVGYRVPVRVDAYPGRVFEGVVRSIADRAEYAPKDVQTRQERANMVFAVRVDLENADQALKPGMPADVELSR